MCASFIGAPATLQYFTVISTNRKQQTRALLICAFKLGWHDARLQAQASDGPLPHAGVHARLNKKRGQRAVCLCVHVVVCMCVCVFYAMYNFTLPHYPLSVIRQNQTAIDQMAREVNIRPTQDQMVSQ